MGCCAGDCLSSNEAEDNRLHLDVPAADGTPALVRLPVLHQPRPAELGRQSHVPFRCGRSGDLDWSLLGTAGDEEQNIS